MWTQRRNWVFSGPPVMSKSETAYVLTHSSGSGCGRVGRRPTAEHAAPKHRKARERGFRVDFRQCVRVASNQLGRFEPRDRCSSESAPSRRACVRVPKRERLPACVAGGRRATCPHSRRKPCAYKTKADLPAFALALWRVRRSLGGGGKVRLYVRQTVAGRVRNDPPYERTLVIAADPGGRESDPSPACRGSS